MATMVEPSSMPLAFTSFSGPNNWLRMPYLAGL
jgi:hypothetical protein